METILTCHVRKMNVHPSTMQFRLIQKNCWTVSLEVMQRKTLKVIEAERLCMMLQ